MSVASGLMSFMFGILCLVQLFDTSEAAVEFGVCGRSEYGRTTTEQTYECGRGRDDTVCSTITTTCSCEGRERIESGYTTYTAWGSSTNTGAGGWDCRNECRRRAGSSGGKSSFTSSR